ncbi:MAG TPA: hypothetical protein DCY93_01860 [Firmicutes bacterium]|nr:hypothetical protein [Bacillota bacterium]
MKNPFKNMSHEAKGVLAVSCVSVVLFASVAGIGIALSKDNTPNNPPINSVPVSVDTGNNNNNNGDNTNVNVIVKNVLKPVDDEVEVLHYFFDMNYDKNDPKLDKAMIHLNGRVYNSHGIDYYTEQDTSFDVRASYSGKVKSITPDDPTYGTIIEIEQEDFTFLYSGLGTYNVKVGEEIESGRKIGVSGPCALSEGKSNILHFEILKDGVPLNPENCYNKTLEEIRK